MDVSVDPSTQDTSDENVALRTGLAFRRKSVHGYPVKDATSNPSAQSYDSNGAVVDHTQKAPTVDDSGSNCEGASNIDFGVSHLSVSADTPLITERDPRLVSLGNGHGTPNQCGTVNGHDTGENGQVHLEGATTSRVAETSVASDAFELKDLASLSSEIPGTEEYTKLFLAKLAQCKIIFDFRNENSYIEGKEVKRRTLVELNAALQETHSKGFDIITNDILGVAVDMVGLNLFRDFSPPVEPGAPEFDVEEDIPVTTYDWPHVELVYKLLTTIIECCSSTTVDVSQRFTKSFLFQLLLLFDTYDGRERDMLKTALHRLYAKVVPHRAYIRSSISNIFYRHIYLNGGKHNGVAELLEIMGSVINGFSLPIKAEHKQFLEKVLIPLHSPKSIGDYHQQLAYCVLQFANKDAALIVPIVHGLLRYWPKSNTTKEVMFLNELEELVDSAAAAEYFGDICSVLVRRINLCLQSFHFQVAERAIYFFNNKGFVRRILEHSQTAIPMVMETLAGTLNSHWSPGMKVLTQNCLQNLKLQCETYTEDSFGDAVGGLNRKRKAEDSALPGVSRAEKWRRVEELARLSTADGNGASGPKLTHITTGVEYQPEASDASMAP